MQFKKSLKLSDLRERIFKEPVYINMNDFAEFFPDSEDIPKEYLNLEVDYVTVDGDGILTIELIQEV